MKLFLVHYVIYVIHATITLISVMISVMVQKIIKITSNSRYLIFVVEGRLAVDVFILNKTFSKSLLLITLTGPKILTILPICLWNI